MSDSSVLSSCSSSASESSSEASWSSSSSDMDGCWVDEMGDLSRVERDTFFSRGVPSAAIAGDGRAPSDM